MSDLAMQHEGYSLNRVDLAELPPADFYDPVIEAYKKDVDRTLLRENLKLSVEGRFRKFESFMEFVAELRGTAQKSWVGRTGKESDREC